MHVKESRARWSGLPASHEDLNPELGSQKQQNKKDGEEECTCSQEASVVKLHPDTNTHMHSVTGCNTIPQNVSAQKVGGRGDEGGRTTVTFMRVNILNLLHPPGQAEQISKNLCSHKFEKADSSVFLNYLSQFKLNYIHI